MRRSPGFLALAAVTLGLGIGAAAAAFTLLDRVVLEPLPVHDEDSVVVVRARDRARALDHFPYTYAAWTRVSSDARTASAVAATEAAGARERLVHDGATLTPLRWSRVAGDFFGVLGTVPVRGRTLSARDDVPGGPAIAVVSHGLWLRRWGGDESVLGAKLWVGDRVYTVVGVVPRDFDYPVGTEVWTPSRPELGASQELAAGLELDLIARLAPGASVKSLEEEIRQLLSADPALEKIYRGVEPRLMPLRDAALGNLGTVAWLLFVGALLLVLVALANVAHLALLRGEGRRFAAAVRHALGAGRRRLLVAPAVDALAITLLASLLAAVTVLGILHWLLSLAPGGLPRLDALAANARTGMVMMLLLGAAALILTVLPSSCHVESARLVAPRSHDRGVDRGPRSLRGTIVALQSALAFWSVVAALLLVRSVTHLGALEVGFDPHDLQIVQLDHSHRLFATPADWPERARRAMEDLRTVPAIEAATLAVAPPLVGRGGFDIVPRLPGSALDADTLPFFNVEFTLPGFFETLRLSLVRGRSTDARDRTGATPVLVLNAAAERILWPGQSALGKRVRLPLPGYEETDWTVVGVAADARYRDLLEIRPSIYVPLAQLPVLAPRWVLVRSTGGVSASRAVRAAFAHLDPEVRVVDSTSLTRRLAAPLARPRLALSILLVVAGLILILAAAGAYGAVAADVQSRRHEFGVRFACGAAPRDIGKEVLRAALARTFAGLIAGATAALATSRLLRSLLFEVSDHDPAAFAAAVAVVLAAVLAAVAEPLRRAVRLDPSVLLRTDA